MGQMGSETISIFYNPILIHYSYIDGFRNQAMTSGEPTCNHSNLLLMHGDHLEEDGSGFARRLGFYCWLFGVDNYIAVIG